MRRLTNQVSRLRNGLPNLRSVGLLRRTADPSPSASLRVGMTIHEWACTDPPPTKWTISRRSPSCNGVCGHWSRGTISRFSSMATRSGFMPSPATSAPRVSADETWGSPLIVSFIEFVFAAGSCRASLGLDGRMRPSLHERSSRRCAD